MSLHDHLSHSLEPWRHAPGWVVALSGGLDSSVLLHGLAMLARTYTLPPLRAVHVAHGLQTAAAAWPGHCAQLCRKLQVPYQALPVKVEAGPSLEQSAREARYQALAAQLAPGEVLLTAQHRDDQAETLLLRLLRGAGVRGAAAMAKARPLGQGTLARPLLDLNREALLAYAQAVGLTWVDDPSNADRTFDRNYLRHEVIPRLRQRWPGAVANLARSASHFAEGLALLEELARQDLRLAEQGAPLPWLGLPSLALAPLRELSQARQRNALQAWLVTRSRLPDTAHWAGWEALRDAGQAATPIWRLADGALCRAQDRAWWLSGPWLAQPPAPARWTDLATPLALPGNGELRWVGQIPEGQVEVRYRQGGESVLIPGRGRRDLKRLLNEAGLPTFVRARLPLLWLNGELVAVANLDGAGKRLGELRWRPPTNDRCLR